MIVLPNTPPAPLALDSPAFPPQLLALRATIDHTPPSNHAESVRYVTKLHDYLEAVFEYLASSTGSKEFAVWAELALLVALTSTPPWTNVKPATKRAGRGSKGGKGMWTLADEIIVSLVVASFMYTRLGAELTNELIESATVDGLDLKWRGVSAHYKSALGLCLFAAQFRAVMQQPSVCPQVFAVLDQACNVGIQMLLLCKSLWLNRMSFSRCDSFESNNNGVLCRVAIWVLDEIHSCHNVASDLLASTRDSTDWNLCYDNWDSYLLVLEKYASAYAALFLSIEYYQKKMLGHALGLVNFGLLVLQSKSAVAQKPSKAHLVSRIRYRLAEKRNERYILSLQSTTSLKVDNSVFRDLSGVILNDLNYVFDLLVLLRVKLKKENDNINFDTVVDWQDVHNDSKWPLGCKMPVSAVPDYVPRALVDLRGLNLSSLRQYF